MARKFMPSEEMYEQAVGLYEEGKTLQQIADAFGIGHPIVRRMLLERGVETRTPGPRRFTPPQEQEILASWNSGMTMKSIASHFNCSVEVVRRLLRASGIERCDHRPVKKLPHELHERVVEAYANDVNVTVHELSRQFSTNDPEIRRILRRNGVPLRDGRTRRGRNNPVYKNGRWVGPDGYVRILVEDDDPMVAVRIPSGRYALEHRLVMSRHLGRPLSSDERVHHKNGIKDDNRIENLEVWSYTHPPGQRIADKPPHCPTCVCGR